MVWTRGWDLNPRKATGYEPGEITTPLPRGAPGRTRTFISAFGGLCPVHWTTGAFHKFFKSTVPWITLRRLEIFLTTQPFQQSLQIRNVVGFPTKKPLPEAGSCRLHMGQLCLTIFISTPGTREEIRTPITRLRRPALIHFELRGHYLPGRTRTCISAFAGLCPIL